MGHSFLFICLSVCERESIDIGCGVKGKVI
jgi:hypothetical protein